MKKIVPILAIILIVSCTKEQTTPTTNSILELKNQQDPVSLVTFNATLGLNQEIVQFLDILDIKPILIRKSLLSKL